MIDAGRALERPVAHCIVDDLFDLCIAVAEARQCRWYRTVDNLEISAPGELLEFDQSEIGFDARGIAIHDQADSPRGRDHSSLSIAVAVRASKLIRTIPSSLRGGNERHLRT